MNTFCNLAGSRQPSWIFFVPTSCPMMAHCHPTDLNSGTHIVYDSANKPNTTKHFQNGNSTSCVELTDRSADVRHAVRCRRVGEAAPHTARPHSLAAPRVVRRRQERVPLPVRLHRHLACSEAFVTEYY